MNLLAAFAAVGLKVKYNKDAFEIMEANAILVLKREMSTFLSELSSHILIYLYTKEFKRRIYY